MTIEHAIVEILVAVVALIGGRWGVVEHKLRDLSKAQQKAEADINALAAKLRKALGPSTVAPSAPAEAVPEVVSEVPTSALERKPNP